jgi:hypothetical protein
MMDSLGKLVEIKKRATLIPGLITIMHMNHDEESRKF